MKEQEIKIKELIDNFFGYYGTLYTLLEDIEVLSDGQINKSDLKVNSEDIQYIKDFSWNSNKDFSDKETDIFLKAAKDFEYILDNIHEDFQSDLYIEELNFLSSSFDFFILDHTKSFDNIKCVINKFLS